MRSGLTDSLNARVEESLEIAVSVGDRLIEWHGLQRLADIAVAWDDGAAALTWAGRALELAAEHGPPGAEALGVYAEGAAQLLLGESGLAEESLARSRDLFRLVASHERVPSPLNIADLRWPGLGGTIGPRLLFEETLQPFQELTGGRRSSHVLVNEAGVARVRGELARARELTDEAEADQPTKTVGSPPCCVRRAYLELAEGDLDAARDRAGARARAAPRLARPPWDRHGALGPRVRRHRRRRARPGRRGAFGRPRPLPACRRPLGVLASTLWRTADLELVRGRYDEADAALEQALATLGTTRRPRWLAHTTLNQAEVALARGDAELAATRFAEARASCTWPARTSTGSRRSTSARRRYPRANPLQRGRAYNSLRHY